MSVHPTIRAEALPSSFHATLNFFVIALVGRAWLAAWLRVFPRRAAAVRRTLHDELSAAPNHPRWQRAIAFFAQLPHFAADQSGAESNPATETGGQPPHGGPPTPHGASVGWSPGQILRDGSLALVMVIAALVALFAEYMDDFDWRGVDLSFGAALGMAIVALLGIAPLAWVVRHRYWVGRATPSE